MAFGVQRHARCTPREAEGGRRPGRAGAGSGGRAAEGREQRRLGGQRRGHLLPPGQIKEAWRGHWEEMVPCFFGKSIRPTLNGAFGSPSSGVAGQVCFQISERGSRERRCRLVLRAHPKNLSALCFVPLPFSLSSGLFPPLSAQASSIMRLQVELSLTPLFGDFFFFPPVTWLHFAPAPCLPIFSG